jgi:peptidyl-prolyl cis-trans isomerase SurA
MFFTFLLAALLLPFTSRAQTADRAQAVDGFAAVVNERVITMGDVMDFIQPSILQLRDAYAGEELERRREEAYKTGLQLLVDQALMVEEFKKLGGAIPDRLVNDRINEVIFEQFDNDRARFLSALAEEQITLDEWRERIRERLIVSALRQQEVNDRIQVSPEGLKQAYEKNLPRLSRPAQMKLSMITLRKDRAVEDTPIEETATRLRGRLLAGEAFGDLAKEFSHDPKAATGGDWGWITPKDLREELRNGLTDLKAGEISEVIETPEALYLARVDEVRAAHVPTLEEVRPELEKEVRRAEADRLYQAWMDRLKRKHAVKIF